MVVCLVRGGSWKTERGNSYFGKNSYRDSGGWKNEGRDVAFNYQVQCFTVEPLIRSETEGSIGWLNCSFNFYSKIGQKYSRQ